MMALSFFVFGPDISASKNNLNYIFVNPNKKAMSSSKMYDKVFAVFGTFMVFFYFALGFFIIFHPLLDVYMPNKALRIVFGIPLIVLWYLQDAGFHTRKLKRVSSARMMTMNK